MMIVSCFALVAAAAVLALVLVVVELVARLGRVPAAIGNVLPCGDAVDALGAANIEIRRYGGTR